MQWHKFLELADRWCCRRVFFRFCRSWRMSRRSPRRSNRRRKPGGKAAAVKPKAIAEKTQKGLAYIVNQQQASGGWGQGGGWRTHARRARGGSRGSGHGRCGQYGDCDAGADSRGPYAQEGEYAKNVAKGVEFIAAKIDKVDKDSPFVTDVLGTQIQSKIGQYVDTFLAGLVLSELKGKMPDETSEKRLTAALDRTMAKIEKHQKADGTFAGNSGWASVLSQALCSKAINRAAQNGVAIREEVLGATPGWRRPAWT